MSSSPMTQDQPSVATVVSTSSLHQSWFRSLMCRRDGAVWITRQELVLVLLALAMGLLLRARHTHMLAVEHFDEGVYASGLWYDQLAGQPYPMSHLYAPPGLAWAIKAAAMIPGLQNVAPFAPSILLGSLSVLVFWLMGRMWFGMTGGLFVVFVAASSDYHILFSRMALTDVPVLFWISAAVLAASIGLQRGSWCLMLAAGVSAGIAWWTKYTGWLALAIIVSGSGMWWLLFGRRSLPFTTLLRLLLICCVTAVVVWLPWYWHLQTLGGYAAVGQNHAGYVTGFDGWRDHLTSHLIFHFRFDSWLSAAAIALGMLAAGSRRWIELVRSTWNRRDSTDAASDSRNKRLFPAPKLLARYVGAAVVLGVVSTGISSFAMLTCIAIGGVSGMFLWPVLHDLYHRSETGDFSPPCAGGECYGKPDQLAAPILDPRIGACFCAAWFLGLVVATPMYYPFPRLSLPLLAAVWIAAAGGISWWIEAGLNVERRGLTESPARGGRLRRMVSAMVVVALVISFSTSGGLFAPIIWQPRTSLRDASWHVAETILQDVAGEFVRPEPELVVGPNGIISPDPVEDSDEGVSDQSSPADLSASHGPQIASPVDASSPLADLADPTCAVYAFGEPAVLMHLHAAGLTALPVQDLNFPEARRQDQLLPTYLILGPNALRTPGLLNDWAVAQRRFQHVTDFYFAPSAVVIYNLFSPEWVAQHSEVTVQKLELYRLQPTVEPPPL